MMGKVNKNILYLILGQMISVFGGAILRFALALYVLDKTGRADIFATILAISSIPVLFAPIGGAIADRFDRRLLMVLMDIINAVLAIVLFFILGFTDSIVMIGLLLFLLSIVGSFDTPVVTASIPLLVKKDQLEQINGLVNGVLSMSNVVAPIIGGILYSILGAQKLIIGSAIFFILAAFIETFLRIPFEKRPMESGVLSTLTNDLKDGFKEVRNNRIIFNAILIAALINFTLSAFFIVGVPIVLRVVLQANDAVYGIGLSVISLSTILGAIFTGFFTKKLRINNLYKIFTLSGLLLILMNIGLMFAGNPLGNTVGFATFILTGIPIGMMMSMISIYLISMVQRITPRENIGKVMATIMAVSQCAVPIGQIIIGLLFKTTTTNVFFQVMIVAVSVLLVSGLCWYLFRHSTDNDIGEVSGNKE
ncbi:MFS transporter [Enterococcus crotali]|uniref:MFS transporter n=1 Tax=Enterococcus crotali TaxID=1453587 RepID=UPI0004A7BB07|nr:MFS transporter [Enterococcus crotali]